MQDVLLDIGKIVTVANEYEENEDYLLIGRRAYNPNSGKSWDYVSVPVPCGLLLENKTDHPYENNNLYFFNHTDIVSFDQQAKNVMLEGNDSSVQYDDIVESQTKLEIEKTADEIALGLMFGTNVDEIANRRTFVSETLDILEQVSADYSDIVDTPQEGISSPQSKRITIEITKRFVHARKMIRMTTVQLVNVIPALKKHLVLAKNREYLIELLSSDRFFYQMFEHSNYGAVKENIRIEKINQ